MMEKRKDGPVMTTLSRSRNRSAARSPEEDHGSLRLRWAWVCVTALLLTWYFLGYVKSLDGYLAPLYQRFPFLEEWVARIPL